MGLAKNILITGIPGVGKTTVIKKVVEKLGERCGGFYTEEIRSEGIRVGFKIVSLDGKTGVLASISLSGAPKVGKYGVNLQEINNIAVTSIAEAIRSEKIVVIDEIGKMEVLSPLFRSLVVLALDSQNVVIATVSEKGKEDFFDEIKMRSDVELYVATFENRDILPNIILNRLRNFLSGDEQ
ncbi:MAG: NTPase [Methanomassiliicoccales archaeon]